MGFFALAQPHCARLGGIHRFFKTHNSIRSQVTSTCPKAAMAKQKKKRVSPPLSGNESIAFPGPQIKAEPLGPQSPSEFWARSGDPGIRFAHCALLRPLRHRKAERQEVKTTSVDETSEKKPDAEGGGGLGMPWYTLRVPLAKSYIT